MPDQLDVGLALSGGGFRAMLFGLGGLWRLNQLGWLRKLDIVTSVSGGSILNGVLATRWNGLQWDASGRATNFEASVARPVRAFANQTIDVPSGLGGLFSIGSTISDKVIKAYDKHLFAGARLQQALPSFKKGHAPRFLFYATSLQTGSSVRIEKRRLADYRVGEIPEPDLLVSQAVAASSAFPPVLSPVQLDFDPALWRRFPGAHLFDDDAYKRRVVLTDGGVYDNMGLQAIWDRCSTVLVSDAGAPMTPTAAPAGDWLRQTMRALDIVTEQTRALRRHKLIEDFRRRQGQEAQPGAQTSKGTFWGIATKIDDYALPNALTRDSPQTALLNGIRTRLNRFTATEQGQLINWGYALADAAMRRYVDPDNTTPSAWPVPEHAL